MTDMKADKTAKISTTQKIIKAGEKRLRAGGYHGFSFREIAADVGIKSASVHHHFPTKEDLAVVVVRAYADRELEQLSDPADPKHSPAQLFASYINIFRNALTEDNAMCLCGLLASESATLPERVNAEVQRFFDLNQKWVETVIKRAAPNLKSNERTAKALMVTATLEGALLNAHCQGDIEHFEKVAGELISTLPVPQN